MSGSRSAPLIAHILFRLDYGGLENGLVNLLNGLPDSHRHAIICLTSYSSFRERISRPDIDVFALDKQPGKDPGAYLRLFQLLRRLRPAATHTRNPGVLDCAAVAALAGVPVRIQGYHGWDIDDLYGRNARRRRQRKLLHPFVTRFVSVSRDISDWLTRSEGIAANRVVQIYNGVDTGRFSPAPARNGEAGDRLTIGTVGRLQAVKNQQLLIDATARLLASHPALASRLTLRIIGDGPCRETLEARIGAAGLDGIAEIVGFRDDVPDQLRSLDLFVLPSRNEGISNTVLEAMASGLPVVATRVGGNPELVEDHHCGRLVSPDDPDDMAAALLRYVEDEALLARHGRAARDRAEARFSLAAMVAAYDGLYHDLLPVE